MFRDLLRKNNKLSAEEAIELLRTESRGVLSVIGDGGYPYGMPMNHFYDDRDGNIYFHCGRIGHRLDSIKQNSKVSFCVYDKGYSKDGEWALNVKSVIVFGHIEIVDDIDVIVDIVTKLSHKFTQDNEYIKKELEEHLHKTLLLKLIPENICGKSVKEA